MNEIIVRVKEVTVDLGAFTIWHPLIARVVIVNFGEKLASLKYFFVDGT